MRIRTGHGPKDWRDVGEGYAGSIPLRGSLVVGGVTPAKPAQLTANQLKPDDRPVTVGRPRKPLTDAQTAARRATWRASKRRARERQADMEAAA
jgi:hypothetical protein